jgi:hypothetical protein
MEKFDLDMIGGAKLARSDVVINVISPLLGQNP